MLTKSGSTILLAIVALAAPAIARAQTRDYNPIRRISATQEQSATAPATQPIATHTETWTPPNLSGPPGQWRSVRQPGPAQLPMPRHVPSPPSAPQPVAPPGAVAPGAVTPEELPDALSSEWQDESPWTDGPSCSGSDCEGCGECCGDECGGCGVGRGFGLCGGACGGHCGHFGGILPRSWQLSAGVHGFKGPPDRGINGNFGFQEGFNLGGTFASCGLGYQFGGQFVQSNLSGSNSGVLRTADRDQQFFTAGLFRRVHCGCGLQGGIVWDVLHDDYYVDMQLSQIRGELSFVGPCLREIGFMFAASDDSDTANFFNFEEHWEPTDQYAVFYRSPIGCGGQFRVWGGWSGRSDGLLGGEVSVPLSDCLVLATNFNYLIPDENGVQSIPEEGWALGMNLVWHIGAGARCNSACRPLFSVADNASFMVDRRQRALAQ